VKILNFLSVSLCVTIIILCFSATYRFVDLQTGTVTVIAILLVFNLFFVSLFFQLNASIIVKFSMLVFGDVLGFFRNLFFHDFSLMGFADFGAGFNAVFAIIYPILNLLWIVPFWSWSLSLLPKHQHTITNEATPT
jgi:hypothetical protein